MIELIATCTVLVQLPYLGKGLCKLVFVGILHSFLNWNGRNPLDHNGRDIPHECEGSSWDTSHIGQLVILLGHDLLFQFHDAMEPRGDFFYPSYNMRTHSGFHLEAGTGNKRKDSRGHT
ncbi:unnamed protein product [Linum tenue]|uniref:Uncharacterized protein n=1 Tax=Linum tenue TaxID=586396 RepID=A0AAV0HEJ1_9ROSI|nr:unnamed protein product [Linum tenue]